MTPDEVVALAKRVGFPIQHPEWRKAVEEFAALVEEAKHKEMQERIEALYALYEQVCRQRDELMDIQRSMVEALRGRIQ